MPILEPAAPKPVSTDTVYKVDETFTVEYTKTGLLAEQARLKTRLEIIEKYLKEIGG